MRIQLGSLMFFFMLFANFSEAQAIQGFEHEEERLIPLRHSLPIYLQHRNGNVSIQGWVQDRIKVTLKMRMLAETDLEAQQEFKKLSLISFEGRERYEFRVGHTPGTDLVTKMRDRTRSPVQVDLEIKAPYQSNLTVVLGEGKEFKLEQWRGGVSVNGKNNRLSFSRLDLSRQMELNCIQCETEIRSSRFKGRISIGSKPLILTDVDSSALSVEGGSEEVRVERGTGKLIVHTTSGRLTVSRFQGKIEFQSEEGGAFLNQISGMADVHTQLGQVMLDFDEVKGPVHVDTGRGDIQVSLYPRFEGAIDLLSLRGEVIVQFPHEPSKSTNLNRYGPESPGRVDGVIGRRTEPLIHAYSKEGGVRLIRKVPTK
jgi:hypothetical protein